MPLKCGYSTKLIISSGQIKLPIKSLPETNCGTNITRNHQKKKTQLFWTNQKTPPSQKKILQGKVYDRRGKGRPPRQWEGGVKDWTMMELSTCTRIV